ncbi:MAG: type 1 glutamine amidotransferase, partial [Alphaproteobacteria bacterium]|nr:type 1 glutamine amidotransferase [Alphaproteobacteria bacterium]
MADNLRFLVIDGYNKEAREELVAGGASMAADQYTRMLKGSTPGGAADIDVLFPADPGASLPKGAELAQYDGIAWTGCSLTVFEDDPRVHTQIEFCREAFRAGVHSFGSCWAAQIAVVAAGGLCAPNPRGREMGVARKIALTQEGRSHPLYEGKSSVFDAFISHVDEITHLPPGAVLLASN